MGKAEHTARQLDFLFSETDTFEVCLLGVKVPRHPLWDNEFAGGKPIVGYFNDKQKAVEVIQKADELVKPAGIYLTVNPCKPDLIARANNRLLPTKTRTSDVDIDRVENFFIDLDPKRPVGISSSADELAKATQLAKAVRADLAGFGPVLYAMSGNGCHLVYKAQGAATEDIRDLLANVANKFGDESVDIDLTVFNPARLIKAYGTTARKGEDVPSRPHRPALIVEVAND